MNNVERIKLEKRIVRGLIRHMASAGWSVANVWDGENHVFPDGEKRAIDAVFNLDEASLRFVKNLRDYDKAAKVASRPLVREAEGHHVGGDWWKGEHGVLLVLGNGIDVISDWNYSDGDADGFSAAMDAYLEKVDRIEAEIAA